MVVFAISFFTLFGYMVKGVGTSLGISAYAIYGTFEVVAVDDISPIWLWGPAISSLTALSGIF